MADKIRKYAKRYWRYTKYMTRYIFKERLFGLDFSMYDKSLISKTNGLMNGYSITPEKHFKAIMEELNFYSSESLRFFDIGCGKGYVLKLATEYPFAAIGGIEYDQRIADICLQNMRKLKLDHVQVFCGDARKFDDYGSYNVFFLFNPFGPVIFRDVLEKIQNISGCVIIYHNPTCHQMIMDTGAFRLIKTINDAEKDYITNIYKRIE